MNSRRVFLRYRGGRSTGDEETAKAPADEVKAENPPVAALKWPLRVMRDDRCRGALRNGSMTSRRHHKKPYF